MQNHFLKHTLPNAVDNNNKIKSYSLKIDKIKLGLIFNIKTNNFIENKIIAGICVKY